MLDSMAALCTLLNLSLLVSSSMTKDDRLQRQGDKHSAAQKEPGQTKMGLRFSYLLFRYHVHLKKLREKHRKRKSFVQISS